ncbi:MFS transporter [Devriesea agamarum]|uniref:MFS transporter n=1 Tax=Devriesea agamarum TaxID=472569 RepID=UPI00071CCB5B|nr:MFS transporter [Devriesea agamarum]
MSDPGSSVAVVWRNRSLVPLAMATVAAGLAFYVPVSALFLESRGQSLTDIFIFESILVASIMLTEIPSGVIADRLDRRWMIIAGFVLNASAEIIFATGHSFMGFAISFCVSGVGIAMLTGVQDAYIYDSLGEDADKTSVGVWGHLSSLGLVAGVLGSIVGSILASFDIGLPAMAAAVAAVVAALISVFLSAQRPRLEPGEHEETSIHAVREGVRLLVSTPILLYIAVASSAAFVLFNAVYTLNQPLFSASALPVIAWGFIGGGAQLVAALYNHHANRVEKRLGRKYALLLAMGFGFLGFVLMAIPNQVVVVAGFILVVLGMNARGPITMAVANRVIPMKRRATVLNVASSLGSLIGILVNPLIGFGADANPSFTVIAIGTILLGLMLTWIPVANKYLDTPPKENDAVQVETH